MNDPLDLTAYTGVPEANGSYWTDIHHTSAGDPLSGSTVGLMMLLSTFQYQAPYMGPTYSLAANQAGKAAYIVSGGQAFQDKVISVTTGIARNLVHSLGLTDTEVGLFLGTAKIVKNRKLDINGPKFYFIKTHLTLTPNDGSIDLKYEW